MGNPENKEVLEQQKWATEEGLRMIMAAPCTWQKRTDAHVAEWWIEPDIKKETATIGKIIHNVNVFALIFDAKRVPRKPDSKISGFTEIYRVSGDYCSPKEGEITEITIDGVTVTGKDVENFIKENKEEVELFKKV